jgi:hypothetical protein
MNYSISHKNSIFRGIVFSLAFVFVIGLSGAATTHAQWYDDGYGYSGYSDYGYDCNSCGYDNYGYGNNTTYIDVYDVYDGYTGGSHYYPPVYTPPPTTYYPPVYTPPVYVPPVYNPPVYVPPVYVPPVYNPPVYTPPPTYYPPVYTPPVTYSPLRISCTPNTSYAAVGSTVTWSASASGGTGYYNYTWSGTDSIYGYTQSLSATYSSAGVKTASVTVSSNGQTITQGCTSAINIGNYQNQTYVYTPPTYTTPTRVVTSNNNNNGLNVACYADPQTASINQPVSWAVEVTGGQGQYKYTWSGTDGLTGSGSSLIKYYTTSGEKSAVVSVTSADGLSSTHACSNTVTIRRAGGTGAATVVTPAPTTQVQTQVVPQQTYNGQSAAALFSLQNIPWGWVAILIILVLFATVLYLIFNRPKI